MPVSAVVEIAAASEALHSRTPLSSQRVGLLKAGLVFSRQARVHRQRHCPRLVPLYWDSSWSTAVC